MHDKILKTENKWSHKKLRTCQLKKKKKKKIRTWELQKKNLRTCHLKKKKKKEKKIKEKKRWTCHWVRENGQKKLSPISKNSNWSKQDLSRNQELKKILSLNKPQEKKMNKHLNLRNSREKKNDRLWEIGQQFLDITYTWILHIDDLLWIGRTTNEQTADHKVHTGRCFTTRLVLTQMIHMHQMMANKQEMFK